MKFCYAISIIVSFISCPLLAMEYCPDFSRLTNQIRRSYAVVKQTFKEEEKFEFPHMMLLPKESAHSFDEQWQSLRSQFKAHDKYGVKKIIVFVQDEYYGRLIQMMKKSKSIELKKAGDFLPDGVLVAIGFYQRLSARL